MRKKLSWIKYDMKKRVKKEKAIKQNEQTLNNLKTLDVELEKDVKRIWQRNKLLRKTCPTIQGIMYLDGMYSEGNDRLETGEEEDDDDDEEEGEEGEGDEGEEAGEKGEGDEDDKEEVGDDA
ncbi:hypothetical protein ABZP36_022154 [Zizania latifolia]